MDSSLRCPHCDQGLAPPSDSLEPGRVYVGSCRNCKRDVKFRLAPPPTSTDSGCCGGGPDSSHHHHALGGEARVKIVNATSSIQFTLNGEAVTISNPDPTQKLSDWLRNDRGLKGTRVSCAEGGCGACVVALKVPGATAPVAANACLRLMGSMQGCAVVTIEGIGGRRKGYHALQEALVKGKNSSGTQCGFCSTGMVMSAYSLLADTTKPKPTEREVEHAFDGNICRCTGYRPILDAFKAFAAPSEAEADIEELAHLTKTPCHALACADACAAKFPGRLVVQAVAVASEEGADMTAAAAAAGAPTWAAPSSIKELVPLLAAHSAAPLRLVVGNTASGVYKHEPAVAYIDIAGVVEMKVVSADATALTVGAAVPLTQLIAHLEDTTGTAKAHPQLYGAIAHHLRKIASTPIRNVGSWAGNLMIAHAHHDFPSDVFTTLAAAGATLQVVDQGGAMRRLDLATGFLGASMDGCAIVSVSIPASPGASFRSFKVMKRHVNAHAAVNMATLWTVGTDAVVKGAPRIVVGGVSGVGVMCPKTAAALTGATLSNATLAAALSALTSELHATTDGNDDTSAPYRVSLAQSLLYKTLLSGIAASAGGGAAPALPPRLKSAADDYVRPVSGGTQTFTPDPQEYPVSEPIPKLSGLEQASGEARYTNDLPSLPGTLHAAFVLSPVANATVSGVNWPLGTTLPGVQRVLTAADLPANNSFMPSNMGVAEYIFAPVPGLMEYAGMPMGLVLADTQANADDAARLLEATATVSDQKKPLVTLDAAIAANSFHDVTMPPVTSGEPIDKALASCAHTVTGSVNCGTQYHFHMETQTAEARPTEEGGIVLHSATQSLAFTQQAVAEATGLPAGKIECKVKRMGGAFGGKITRSMLPATAVSVATLLTGKPVACRMSLSANMRALGKRHPYRCDYQAGVDASGKLAAIKLLYTSDDGYCKNEVGGTSMALTDCDGGYYCANWDVRTRFAKTNTPVNTAARAPGCLPATFFMETVMEHLASATGTDPATFRAANLYSKGQKTPYGQTLQYCSLGALWSQAVADNDFAARKTKVQAFNAANRWRKRGLSIQANKYGIAWGGANYSCYVAINAIDGSVVVSHGGTEVGQGVDTKVAQVVALTLKCPLSAVSMRPNSTDVHPNNECTGGSITSELCCAAAIQACTPLRARLDLVAGGSAVSGGSGSGGALTTTTTTTTSTAAAAAAAEWATLCHKAGGKGVDLCQRAWHKGPGSALGPFNYNSYGIMCVEVEIDVLTGETEIVRADMLYDNGTSLNYDIDIGQVEGAFVMGIGYFLTEELIYNAEDGGVLASDGTWLYKPPSALDIAQDMRITMLKDAPNPVGVLRSKAVAEPPICMSSNIMAAMRAALVAARTEAGASKAFFATDAPLTPEKVQAHCLVDPKQFTL